jgi:phage gpG-like protein
MRIELQVEAKKLREMLGDMRYRSRHLRPVLSVCGRGAIRSIQKNFDEEGRPEAWEPLKLESLESLAKNIGSGGHKIKNRQGFYTKHAAKIIGGHKILTDKGTLRNSVTMAVDSDAVFVGPGILPYARIHQKGFSGKNKAGVEMDMPARPYCMLQEDDAEKCAEAISGWIVEGRTSWP